MRNGRLGSWESESQLRGYFDGWLGQLDPGGTTGGGVQSYQQFLTSRDLGLDAAREESRLTDISASMLSTEASAANINTFAPGKFLMQHPYLNRFRKKQ